MKGRWWLSDYRAFTHDSYNRQANAMDKVACKAVADAMQPILKATDIIRINRAIARRKLRNEKAIN